MARMCTCDSSDRLPSTLGRRTEILEYARRALTGSFMSDVVRSKADYQAKQP